MQTDTVFAAAGAVHGDGPAHHARVDGFGGFAFGRLIGIDQQQHMKIAVADMADH